MVFSKKTKRIGGKDIRNMGKRRGWSSFILLRNSVRIAKRTSVEIVRDALPAGLIFKGSALAGNGEEGFEARLVEVAGWILGGMVGHHARREGVAGWGD